MQYKNGRVGVLSAVLCIIRGEVRDKHGNLPAASFSRKSFKGMVFFIVFVITKLGHIVEARAAFWPLLAINHGVKCKNCIFPRPFYNSHHWHGSACEMNTEIYTCLAYRQPIAVVVRHFARETIDHIQ